MSYAHRDKNFFTDSNIGFIDVFDGVDAHLGLASPFRLVGVVLLRTNLLDKASLGGNAPLPVTDPPLFFRFGGYGPGPLPPPSFSPLNKGRVLGVQLRISY